MQVGILGPLVVEHSGRPVQIGGARLRSLLTRLAADPGRWVSAGTLATALWPDDDAPGDQANALQSLISRLRRALPDPQLIESGPAGYRLQLAVTDLDAAQFEGAVAQGRRQLIAGQIAAGAEQLRTALALWRGPALDDVLQLPYATTWATRLDELRLSAIEDRIDADLTLGQLTGLVAELEELAAASPLRERLHGQLIRTLARSGRQAEALKAYERVRRVLADELGVDPSPALQAVHLAVLRAEDQEVPEPLSGGAGRPHRRTNLRPSLTSFVGRENDIAKVSQTLHRSRLVTLVGAGGAGKTRLSVEVASRLDDCGHDGIWQAELAPISDPEGLAAAALGAIGTLDSTVMDGRKTGTHRDDLSRLVEAIGERDIVLLLDNCEHVIDAAAKLAEQLLGQCPELKILATSREPLGITGESLWPVQPLVTPAGGETDVTDLAALARLRASAAVQLFVDRGALVRPGFELEAENAAAVSEICRRLDGLPLAIELAAARLRTMSAQSIALRLQDRFRLLTGGSRTAMPRHQTLRAVVAWSWELLTESERELAEQLSVFPGGATVEAAAAVTADPVDDDVLDQLTALADKSLLVPVDGEPPRYRMLETIREFSSERLAERGRMLDVRAAFTRYFLEQAESAEPRLRGRDQLAAMKQLNDERENLMAAIRFAVDGQDAASAVRIGAAMAWYWTLLGRHEEAASLLGQALAVPGDVPRAAYVIALASHTVNAAAAGRGMPTADDLQRIAVLAEEIDPLTSHPLITLIQPAIAVLADDQASLVAAVERLLNHSDPWALAMLHMVDVVSAENAGDLTRMRDALPRALNGFRAIGDRWGSGTALQALANLRGMDGDIDGAIAALDEARALMSELRATDDETFAQVRIGMLMLQNGPSAVARGYLERAVTLAEESGAPHAVAYAYLGMAMVAMTEADHRLAQTWAQRAYQLMRNTTGPAQILAVTLAVLAHLHVLDGDLVRARARLVEAWGPSIRSRDMPAIARVMTSVAELARAEDDAGLAAQLIGAGERVRGGADQGDADLRRLIDGLRAQLGDARYEDRLAAGRALDQAAGIELAARWLGFS